jgi:Winged helix DNA-binding domain
VGVSAGFRLQKHHLATPAPAGSLVRVAREICGVHAQVLSAADLQVRSRVRGHAPGDLARALWDERSVVKTWLMRGTLHIVPADDLPLYVGALDNRGEYANAWLKAFGTTKAEMERLIAAVGDALDGEALTRAELVDAVGPKVGKSAAKRLASGWGEFLKPASRRGVLCFGPSRGQNVAFVRPDQWLGGWREVGRGEARTELLRRFLGAYGPASVDDFERWIGSQRRIKEPWEELARELVEVEPKRFVLAADAKRLRTQPKGLQLLPAFDPYVLFPHSDRPVPEQFRDRVYRKAAWISQTIVDRGTVVGVWKHKQQGKTLRVELQPFEPLKPTTLKTAEREAWKLAKYVGLEIA